MEIAVVGVNHNTTPIEVREKVSFTETKKIEGINYLLDGRINEAVILSTCNRSEIYICSKKINEGIKDVEKFYKEFFHINNIHDYLFVKKGKEAINHVYMVASGMDSVVLGEDQILGQVRDALDFSMEVGGSKKILNKLFREAITAAKDIKCRLKISEIPLSTSYIGIKLLKEQLKSLNGKKALIVGAGKISSLSLKYLKEEGLEEIYITNRTHGKLKDLCFEFPELKAIKYEDRYSALKHVDIVITATSAPHIIFTKKDMEDIKKELYIMDLALPRDVEQKVEEIKNIHLYDIDDLKKTSEENLIRREELAEEALEIIKEDVEEFMEWLEKVKVDPVIKSLNDRCSEIQQDTLDYINRKLDLDCREQKIIEKMLGSALKRVIREPIKNLKDIKETEHMDTYIDMVNKLFDF
ncbi:glutamyl-tRNA reductase [Haloimpatiens lingqiaonensis]|uniref:glutamyl-tRNA reductase n=1 Tax=Haloimpatiens lingqiaonensis TaxID=1380675 RepID=UPI0010FE2A6C|nr:glutamyl-tRNA reductase [Haloimpatiens lingqiaonensis]